MPTDFFAENPLTKVYDALWSLVEAHPEVDNIVRLGNRVKYNSATDRRPKKSSVSTADLPELSLVSEGGTLRIKNTTSSTKLVRRYSWIISTGDWRVNHYLYQVEWMIICAMCDWDSVVSALQYDGANFVKRTDVVNITEGMTLPAGQEAISGWTSLWSCEIEMHFRTSSLLDELN